MFPQREGKAKPEKTAGREKRVEKKIRQRREKKTRKAKRRGRSQLPKIWAPKRGEGKSTRGEGGDRTLLVV